VHALGAGLHDVDKHGNQTATKLQTVQALNYSKIPIQNVNSAFSPDQPVLSYFLLGFCLNSDLENSSRHVDRLKVDRLAA